ncbi:transducin beta-like protein 2 [Haliotis cracherodii]|uniref:transducin beta-like protein 2 n=1 Tax=Haliotis cracherodii TaxID=6455 RepID=UPI0039E79681
MADETSSVPVIAVTAAVGAVVLLFILLCGIGRKEQKEEEQEQSEEPKRTEKSNEKSSKKTKVILKGKKAAHPAFTHQWLAGTLKGHGSPILAFDFSPNGKYVLTCAEDRSLMLWSVKEFLQKEHKFIRGSVELDHATKLAFSPDSRAIVASLGNANIIRIFRLGKKEDGSSVTIQGAMDFRQHHSVEIICIGIASNGKFIMTCHRDTTIIIYNLKGEVLSRIDTHQMSNSFGAVSPCGRFVGSSGFTPDVKVWEVLFDKSGTFKEVKRAYELKGHGAGVHSFSFSNDSSRMASVSKDGTWKFWDTDVRYEFDQDPKLLYTGKLSHPSLHLITLSPDGRSVAIAGDLSISICSTVSGKEEEYFENVHADAISQIGFDVGSKFLLSAGDKHVQVIHNVTGYRATIADLEQKEKKANTEAMRERIRNQIKDARSSLSVILGTTNGHAESK